MKPMSRSLVAASTLLVVVALCVFVTRAQLELDGSGFQQELNSLDFDALIGGPLQAVIRAQATSALSTVEFIESIGFTPDPDDPDGAPQVTMVDFLFNSPNAVNASEPVAEKLAVPFLTMLPIPYIRVTDVQIKLNVQLDSIVSSEAEQSSSFTQTRSKGGGWLSRTKVKTTTKRQSKSKQSGQEKRSYHLEVAVRAENAGLPEGTSRMLDLLENIISRQQT